MNMIIINNQPPSTVVKTSTLKFQESERNKLFQELNRCRVCACVCVCV